MTPEPDRPDLLFHPDGGAVARRGIALDHPLRRSPLETESTVWNMVPKYLCAILAPISMRLLLLVQSDFKGFNDILLNVLRVLFVSSEIPFDYSKTTFGASLVLDAVRPIENFLWVPLRRRVRRKL